MLWKDYCSVCCSAGLFREGLCLLARPQAARVVLCISPSFLVIPSGSFPPAVSGPGRADGRGSEGEDAGGHCWKFTSLSCSLLRLSLPEHNSDLLAPVAVHEIE